MDTPAPHSTANRHGGVRHDLRRLRSAHRESPQQAARRDGTRQPRHRDGPACNWGPPPRRVERIIGSDPRRGLRRGSALRKAAAKRNACAMNRTGKPRGASFWSPPCSPRPCSCRWAACFPASTRPDCRAGCNGCSPRRCSSGRDGAFTRARGTPCAAAAPTWTCWSRSAPAWPTASAPPSSCSACPAQHLYFEASAAIITLVLIGKLLEARAKATHVRGDRSAAAAAAGDARASNATAQRSTSSCSDIVVGDIVRGASGRAHCRWTARCVDGASSVDESMLTGESLPVGKQPGSAGLCGNA